MIKRLILVIIIIIVFAWGFSELAEHTGLPVPPNGSDTSCQSFIDGNCATPSVR